MTAGTGVIGAATDGSKEEEGTGEDGGGMKAAGGEGEGEGCRQTKSKRAERPALNKAVVDKLSSSRAGAACDGMLVVVYSRLSVYLE